MDFLRAVNRVVIGLVVLIIAAAPAVAGGYPLQGLTPWQKPGPMVTIPGAPLPPVPESSIRTAIAFYQPLLAVLRLGGDRPAIARGYGYLATLYASLRDYPKAEELFDKAQKILEEHGATGRDLAWVHNDRGLVRIESGQYAGALHSLRAALAILDPEHEDFRQPRAVALENLGSVYCLLGDAEHSEEAYLDALELLRRLEKEGSRSHQATRGNLAVLYATIGDFGEARRILDKLVVERGLSQPLRFQVLTNLGYALSALHEFPEAKRRLTEAQALAVDESQEQAIVLMNLAAMYNWAEDFEAATDYSEKALRVIGKLYGEDSRFAAAAKANLAVAEMRRGALLKADRLLVEARTILAKASGDEEAMVGVTKILALVAQRRGQRERAADLSRKALTLEKKHLERILAFGSEAQRLAYRIHASPYDQLANLGDPILLADAVLTMKGAVLESLLVERALARKSTAPEDLEQLDRINALKVEIMEKIGRGEPEPVELERALKKTQTAFAKRLAPRLQRSQVRAELKSVQAALDANQVLIEIIRYQRYAKDGKLVDAYGGVVIPRTGKPSWVPIGDAEPLDRLIESVVTQFGGEDSRSVRPPEVEGDATAALRELDDRLWKPLAKALPAGTRKILLSPDGATSFLPWAALLDKDRKFLAERWQLTQIGSGRDLLRTASASTANTLFALADGRGDLPHSRDEVEEVVRAAKQREWRTTLLIGEKATEARLFQHPRPRILHLATHGGQLQRDVASEIENRLSRNAMYRGYLLLGGGDDTLDRWNNNGAAVPFAVDGILTAEEASSLDLGDTWLTVLSACDTGAGDLRAGEGVLGLRRGFSLAGTRNLLFSLWPVQDNATAEFMKAFYERLFRTNDPARAFQETQVAELLRWKETRGISGAVYRAGGFVLTR